MSADNALSQAQIATFEQIGRAAKLGTDTALTTAQKMDLGSALAIVIEDGLEFSGIGNYGSARLIANAVASAYNAYSQMSAANQATVQANITANQASTNLVAVTAFQTLGGGHGGSTNGLLEAIITAGLLATGIKSKTPQTYADVTTYVTKVVAGFLASTQAAS